jgi:ribosomal protein L37AE/L43A
MTLQTTPTMHPLVRALPVCPNCTHDKDSGLVICWPCHKLQKQHNKGGYSPRLEQKLDALELHLSIALNAGLNLLLSNGKAES